MATGGSLGRTISGMVFVAIVVVVSALIFVLIWLGASPSSAFYALIEIGIVALVFSLAAYLSQAVVTPSLVARAGTWAYLAMGFTVVFVTIGAYPDGSVSTTTRIYLAFPFLILFAIAVLGIWWRSGQRAAEQHRTEERKAWQSQPTASAFDYAAAQRPSVPPPSSSNPNAPPPGAPGR